MEQKKEGRTLSSYKGVEVKTILDDNKNYLIKMEGCRFEIKKGLLEEIATLNDMKQIDKKILDYDLKLARTLYLRRIDTLAFAYTIRGAMVTQLNDRLEVAKTIINNCSPNTFAINDYSPNTN